MSFVYEVHLIDATTAPQPDIDLASLAEPTAAMAFGHRMACERLAAPSPRLIALVRKVELGFAGQVGVLAGESDEPLNWDEARSSVPVGAARCSRRWTVMVDGDLVSTLVPRLLQWCRQAQVDACDPQLQVYFRWNDPNGEPKIANPLAHEPRRAARQAMMRLHVWAAKIAPLPKDPADAALLVHRLDGKTLKGRRFYLATAQALWSALALRLPSLRDALQAFDRDPCDWGADLDAPCDAVWTLEIRCSVMEEFWPVVCELANQRGLCVLAVGAEPGLHLPGQPFRPAPSTAAPAHPAAGEGPSGIAPATAMGSPERVPEVLAELAEAQRTTQARDALAALLKADGFRREGLQTLEKRYAHGSLQLLIQTKALRGGKVGLRVYMGARMSACPEVLQQFRRDEVLLQGDLDDDGSSVRVNLLYYRDLTTSGGVGNACDLDAWHVCYCSPAELNSGLVDTVLPVVKEVLSEPTPWFLNPPDLLASFKKALSEGGLPAGMTPMNMEDLILARLSGEPDWDTYVARRIALARESPALSRSTPQALTRMAKELVRRVSVDQALSQARARFDGTEMSPLGKAGWAILLGPLGGLIASGMGLPDSILVVAVLASMAYAAWQLFKVGGHSGWRFVLPWTVLFPPLALLVIVVLGLRRNRADG